ncbi:MAG TPA: sigma-70 family RNA polymerase sigma factor [Verrucomicrobiae bacterium]|nr:sigma-70 family RNA polymerase sigma factor [Verrucomicrobiae bacterium]
MTPDSELLGRYARTRSEDAFAELVRRHVNLVYSAALRQVGGDAHLAQDVAQAVFTDLARKAASLARREALAGWLYTSAHYAASKIARMEDRRRHREEKFMREPVPENEVGRVTPCAPDWEQVRSTLDDVMHELKETDREAILLRYFENRQFAEVGAKLGLNENAARMRVERALEKLRALFAKRGITPATALASVISANAVQMAPAGLATTLAMTSIAAAGTGTAFAILKIMTATQLKLGIGALIVAGAATALVIQHQTQTELRMENESLRQQLVKLQTDNQSLSNRFASSDGSQTLSNNQSNELLKLRGEVGVLRQQTKDMTHLKTELAAAQNKVSELTEVQFKRRQSDMQSAINQMMGFVGLYAQFHNEQYPTNIDQVSGVAGDYPGDPAPNIKWPGDIGFDAIEFLGSLAGLRTTDALQMHDKIIIREKTPRQTPDGKWERIYGFADQHTEIHISDDGNFDAFEQQHMISPPNQ